MGPKFKNRNLWVTLTLGGCAVGIATITSNSVKAERPITTLGIHSPLAQQPLVIKQQLDPAGAKFELLPNWEVGRNAGVPLPNYQPGTVEIRLLDQRPSAPNVAHQAIASARHSIAPAASPTVEATRTSRVIYGRPVDSKPGK